MFIKGQIKVLVVIDEKKTVEGEFGFWGLDFAQLAISADGLSDREILFAIEKLAPKA